MVMRPIRSEFILLQYGRANNNDREIHSFQG
jgi:hypothetical protein